MVGLLCRAPGPERLLPSPGALSDDLCHDFAPYSVLCSILHGVRHMAETVSAKSLLRYNIDSILDLLAIQAIIGSANHPRNL